MSTPTGLPLHSTHGSPQDSRSLSFVAKQAVSALYCSACRASQAQTNTGASHALLHAE